MDLYVEHAPHPDLARHVECYWTLACAPPGLDAQPTAVLPDGCMDILFSFAGEGPNEHTVIGTMTRPLVTTPTAPMELLGVRFRPGGATPFLSLPAHELTDQTAPLEDLWGRSALDASARLEVARTIDERVFLLDRILRERLGRADQRTDQRVLQASELAVRTRGAVTVDLMAEASGLSARQLERRFLATVGLSPKVAGRIVRFRTAVARLHKEPDWPLSRVALDCGYADQPHFTREFKALAGVTPAAYRRRATQV